MSRMMKSPQLTHLEKHRPQLHFSPVRNWMNDPNGMVYYEGMYHLFYQYNPADKVWNDMHWGHAVSADLIHWQEKPIALYSEREADGLGHIFSGSAVVDWHNSSGLGNGSRPPLIAIFTHSSDSGVQVQSIAYSNDRGETWTMYENNPVIAYFGEPHFRDPKVFWEERTERWIMVIAADKVIKFYRSKDLIHWEFIDDFGAEFSQNDGVWECPDLFPLKSVGSQADAKTEKWVLLVSLNPGGPNGGSGTRYFIGNFDGERFCPDHSDLRWLDFGPDNYAGVTWSDTDKESKRRILIGWMSNWRYANDVPTDPWRGAMTLPRELSLIRIDAGLYLAAPPIRELERLRQEGATCVENVTIDQSTPFVAERTISEPIELEITFASQVEQEGHFQLRLFNNHEEEIRLSVDLASNQVRLNREKATYGLRDKPEFSDVLVAPLLLSRQGDCSLRLVKDTSSIELITGEGLALFSALYYVESPLDQIEIISVDETSTRLNKIAIYSLRSIW